MVHRIPLLPPDHRSKVAKPTVVPRSTTSGISQPATTTRLGQAFSSSIVQTAPSKSEIVPNYTCGHYLQAYTPIYHAGLQNQMMVFPLVELEDYSGDSFGRIPPIPTEFS